MPDQKLSIRGMGWITLGCFAAGFDLCAMLSVAGVFHWT